ncbi:MAG: hypothetical protein ACXQT3_00330 [Methermicoccaceae archaeon]
MSTYTPNDTNCTGWEGEDANRPPSNLTMGTESALTSGELDTISVDDGNSISYTGGSGYPGHRIRFAIAEDENTVTSLTVTVKGCGDRSTYYEYYLYIRKDSTGSWEQLDYHETGSKDTVTGTISTDCAAYIDTNGYVYVLVMGSPKTLTEPTIYTYYAELQLTSSGGSSKGEMMFGPHRGLVNLNRFHPGDVVGWVGRYRRGVK